MDIYSKSMDKIFIHLAPYPRSYPNGLPVQSIGYIPHKLHQEKCAFATCNFSLILRGKGFYRIQNRTLRVEAPCVITQWPGEPLLYGPDQPHGSWDELFIIFDSNAAETLCERNLYHSDQPIWPIHDPNQVMEQCTNLMALLQDPDNTRMIDRLDRVCERLLMETRIGQPRISIPHEEELIRMVRQHLRDHRFEPLDFHAIASNHGLSPSTFRRHWNRYMQAPPARYVRNLRIREARRLLAETDLTVSEIARRIGFEDPFYFSRCFRRMTGMSPKPYRERFQLASRP